MKRFLPLFALLTIASLAYAEDALIGTAITTSTSSAQSVQFECGSQLNLQARTSDASYRICHGVTGATCTALTTDHLIPAGQSIDIRTSGDSGGTLCRVAFIATGAGTAYVYRVTPATLPVAQ